MNDDKMAGCSHSRMHTKVSMGVTLGGNLFTKKVSSPGQLFWTSSLARHTCS